MATPDISPDTIYFLKTETPHIGDFTFFGPFHCLEALVPSLRNKLKQNSPSGLVKFDNLISWSDGALTSFEHIDAPLSGGHTLTIRVIKQQNAEVRAALPGKVWNVVSMELRGSPLLPSAGGPKMKDLSIGGAFVSLAKANEAARRIAAEKVRETPGARKMEQMGGDGTVNCMVMSKTKAWLIEATFESGIETF